MGGWIDRRMGERKNGKRQEATKAVSLLWIHSLQVTSRIHNSVWVTVVWAESCWIAGEAKNSGCVCRLRSQIRPSICQLHNYKLFALVCDFSEPPFLSLLNGGNSLSTKQKCTWIKNYTGSQQVLSKCMLKGCVNKLTTQQHPTHESDLDESHDSVSLSYVMV